VRHIFPRLKRSPFESTNAPERAHKIFWPGFGAPRAPITTVNEIQSDEKNRFNKRTERRLKMKSLRNRILTLVAVGLLCIGFSASASQAQAVYKGSFTINHDIRWQDATMPAGEYTFTVESTTRSKPVLVTGPAGTVFQLPLVTSQGKIGGPSVLKLEWRGDVLCVREMDLAEVGLNIRYHLPKATESDKLLAKAHTGGEEVLIAMTTK
jgi:hypothetical protein